MSKNYQEVNGFIYVKNVFVDEVEETKEESMFDRSLEIQNLKLTPDTALFWGDDAEDVKIVTACTKGTFDQIRSVNPDRPAFFAGHNDDEMFEIIFSMDDECAYDLIEDYYEEWGKYIEVITE